MQRIVSALDFGSVRSLYDERVAIHQEIREDFKNQRVDEYVQTALGIANRYGNFSASE